MRRATTKSPPRGASACEPSELAAVLRRYCEGQQHLRRGICLLNAGAYDAAARAFGEAARANPDGASLPHHLATCWTGGAAADLTHGCGGEASTGAVAARIRQALALWKAGQAQEAVGTLRKALRDNPDSAELHFQLGTLLAELDDFEEAELRFTQAIQIDPEHADALVGMALCRGLQRRMDDSIQFLSRAQHCRPHDAHIALMLSHALRPVPGARGLRAVQARMPCEDARRDEQAIGELSRIVEAEPEFVNVFLELPADEVDARGYTVLAATIQRALERSPDEAELHRHYGRVLARLGRSAEAMAEIEHALQLDPRCVTALIQLAELYSESDRWADAATRLEQALALGVEYADVYFRLGNAYRQRGQPRRARGAYLHALRINERYAAARAALESLAA